MKDERRTQKSLEKSVLINSSSANYGTIKLTKDIR
jgi:hypothetical protein